jgi:diadenylate cyclase
MEFFGTLAQQLWLILRHVGPVEVVDVLLVAFLFYQLLRLVRGTQATQLIVGLVFLGIVGVLAGRLQLILISWLFQTAAPFIVIGIIVLFQPELRRILDQVGRIGHLGRPLSAFNPQLFNRSIAEAIRATERLSARRTGALIAFERDVGLEDYAATGVRINGELSAEFLQSIFFPNSPLHDGAVIVRGDTILAAGCLLPLADEATVRERLGTRHRAAVGLSLASDALLLVVSEETGGISVVENGRITRNLDADGLRKHLSGSLDGAAPNGTTRARAHILGWRLTGPKP